MVHNQRDKHNSSCCERPFRRKTCIAGPHVHAANRRLNPTVAEKKSGHFQQTCAVMRSFFSVSVVIPQHAYHDMCILVVKNVPNEMLIFVTE